MEENSIKSEGSKNKNDCTKKIGECESCKNGIYNIGRDTYIQVDEHFYYHSECISCLICGDPFLSKEEEEFLYSRYCKGFPYYFWHQRCCKCICGCIDYEKFDLVYHMDIIDGTDYSQIRHTGCKWNKFMCLSCETVIGFEDSINGFHSKCSKSVICYICRDGLPPLNTQYMDKYERVYVSVGMGKIDSKLKHKKCCAKLCNICIQPITHRCDHNNITHKKCNKIRMPRICNRDGRECVKWIFNPFSWFDNRAWSPKTHLYYPCEVRQEIKILLMLHQREIFKKGNLVLIPKDILYIICGFVATLSGRKIVEKHVIYGTCTPVRCFRDIMCMKCYAVSDDFSVKEACNSRRCLKFPNV